ncbi:helix-turn-helix transcriptional regulator [Marinilactibacillus sp. Marseille-P9653]|uniref:ArsR/SmtB family transcription factor n=1 Tax=Marinilactibacillus sp. Marseille-P9653 TaxID=2866583 RepID=UPI001CE4983E|nr:metalloregulator ArsR/SmtB family transcription factor [Marinilactibacillus sp. Marseille-P9653]
MKPSLTSPLENESIQEVSKIFKIISDPTRLSILFLLQKEELSVGTIAQSLSMEQSAISHQLKTLKTSRLVKAKRAGKSMIYSLDDLHIFSILEQVLTHIKEPEK